MYTKWQNEQWPSQRCPHPNHPEPMNKLPCGKRDFADVIKLKSQTGEIILDYPVFST